VPSPDWPEAGSREVGCCKWCGSPIVRVGHGPGANHTIEPLRGKLSEEEERMYEEARRSIVEARR
jgi:hypothetical protein